MSNPVSVSCAKDVWTKVATAVTSARVYYESDGTATIPVQYRMTYRQTGAAAPLVAEAGVVLPLGDRDNAALSYRAEHGEPVDIYIKPIGGVASVVVHAPCGGAVEQTQPSSVVSDVAIVAAPVGGINVPNDDGIVMDGSKDIAFQLYLLGGQTNGHVDRTATVIFQVSDDVLVGAARQWVTTAAGYDQGTDATSASWSSVGLTSLGAAVDFENVQHRRIRANYTFSAAPGTDHPGAVIIAERRK